MFFSFKLWHRSTTYLKSSSLIAQLLKIYPNLSCSTLLKKISSISIYICSRQISQRNLLLRFIWKLTLDFVVVSKVDVLFESWAELLAIFDGLNVTSNSESEICLHKFDPCRRRRFPYCGSRFGTTKLVFDIGADWNITSSHPWFPFINFITFPRSIIHRSII